MGKRAQRIPSWPGVIHSNKGRIHLRRPTRDITFRLRRSGGPYIPVCPIDMKEDFAGSNSERVNQHYDSYLAESALDAAAWYSRQRRSTSSPAAGRSFTNSTLRPAYNGNSVTAPSSSRVGCRDP